MIPHIGRVGFSPSFVPGTSKPINFTEARSKVLLTRPEGWLSLPSITSLPSMALRIKDPRTSPRVTLPLIPTALPGFEGGSGNN